MTAAGHLKALCDHLHREYSRRFSHISHGYEVYLIRGDLYMTNR